MSADFLVEIGTEELPPKVLSLLCNSFSEGVTSLLREQNLQFGEVTSYGAPRRLALLVKDLETRTPDQNVVNWGPPSKVAFDSDGNPTRLLRLLPTRTADFPICPAWLKMMASRTSSVSAIQTGSSTESLLGDIINQSLAALPIPKPMRWGKPVRSLSVRFSGR